MYKKYPFLRWSYWKLWLLHFRDPLRAQREIWAYHDKYGKRGRL